MIKCNAAMQANIRDSESGVGFWRAGVFKSSAAVDVRLIVS